MLAIVRGHAEILGPFTVAGLAGLLGLETWEVAVAAGRLESEGVVLRGQFSPVRAPESPGEELCDRRLLARVHRYTLDRLRSEIEPVSAQDFLRSLFERHHLTPRSRAGGRAALREVIGMLQGFEIGAAAWEEDILAARVAGYRAEWLDQMCLAGEVAWARLTPRRVTLASATSSTSRATPMTIALRRELGWMLEAVRGSESAETVELPAAESATGMLLATLRQRGALFLDDLARASRLSHDEVGAGLWDLVGRGMVTGDGFAPLRALMASGRAPRSKQSRARAVEGRWSLVDIGLGSEPLPTDELADRVAGQLLARYGVVFREVAAREAFSVPWRDVARALRRREARGLARGGRFVAGFLGEQYALPDAVDALRRVRRQERSGELARIRPSDPLNLVGILTPGPRVPAPQSGWLVFRDGALVDTTTSAPGEAMPPLALQ